MHYSININAKENKKMLDKSNFKPKALKEAEDYFKNVHMTQEQHKIFLDFVKLFLKYIPIDELSAKGIGWRAVSKWQLDHKRDLMGLEKEVPEERIKAIEQLLDVVKNELLATLKDPKYIPALEKAIKETLEFYIKQYAHRKKS